MKKEHLIKIFIEQNKKFKKFLDENIGSRARIMRLFEVNVKSEIEEILILGNRDNHLSQILLSADTPNEKEIEKLLRLNYLEVFSPKNEILRKKAAMRIFILIGVKYLDEQIGIGSKWGVFENEEKLGKIAGAFLRSQWTEKYRPMFFFYLDQTTDSGGDWKDCEKNGIIYRNMLYKLRKYMMEKKWRKGEKWDFYEELKSDFAGLKENSNPKIEDKKQQMEMLKEENAKIMKFSELKAAIDALKLEDGEEFYFLIYGRKRTSDSLDTYKEYIVEKDGEMLEELKEQINLDATLWHYKNIFYDLFINSQMEISKKNLEEIKNNKNENYEGKKRKLCKLQYIFQHSLNEGIKNLMDLPKIGNVSCNDDKRINIISSLIVGMQTIKKKIYFDYLDWLISNFEEFQQFLLKLDCTFKINIIHILNVENKEGSEKFELLGKLEKKHPKWLKIDEMYVDMQMELYKTILETKEYLPESMISQRRIAMSTMLREIKKAQNASEKCGIGIKYPEDFKMIKEKIEKLLEEIYEKRGENFDSMENICILTRFRQLIKMEYIEGKNVNCIEHNGKENLIKEYKNDLCKEGKTQYESWQHQKKILEEYHTYFIITSEYNIKYEKLIKKLGGMIRLKLLVPNSMEKESPFLSIAKDFSMNSILREHFLELLNTKSEEEDKIANELALNFFNWARYIDKKLEKLKNSKTKSKIIAQIWREKRLDLLNKYDWLGNIDIDTLKANTKILARFHLDILEVIKKAEEEVFSKEKLEKIFNEIFGKWRYEEHDKEWEENKEGKLAEYSKQIYIFNRDEMMQQFNTKYLPVDWKERQNFHKNIVEECLENEEAAKIFVELIGQEEMDKIFKQPKEKQKGNEFAKTKMNIKDKLKTLSNKGKGIERKKLIETGMSSSNTGEKFEGLLENVPSSSKNQSATEFIHAIGNESAEMSGIASNSMFNNLIHSTDFELHAQSQNLMDESQRQQHSSGIHSTDSELYMDKRVEEKNPKEIDISSTDTGEKFENLENVPSSPKSPSTVVIHAIDNESVESSGIASNSMLISNSIRPTDSNLHTQNQNLMDDNQQNSNILHSTDSDLHAQIQNLMDESQRQQHSSGIHSTDSEVHSDKRVEENKQTEIESGDSSEFKEEDQIKRVIKKNRNSQKSRQNKKERKFRNIAEREVLRRKKEQEKAEAKIKEKAETKAKEEEEAKAKEEEEAKAKEEEEANKIRLKEERKQIEDLIIVKLKELLKNKSYGEFADSNELNQSEYTILEMMDILAKWNKESRLLISGSMQLKLNSIDSDIDLIVLLPYEPSENWQNEFDKNFMGDFETKCVGKKCENGDEISLYCFLCQENKVISLEKINGNVPIIKMKLTRNIPVDINMALVPKELLRNFPTIQQQQQEKLKYYEKKKKMEKILEYQPSLAEIDELIRNIIIGIGAKHLRMSIGDKRNGMIFTLSGYRSNKQIVHLLTKEKNESRNVNITVKNYENFRIAYLALKLWAKNHFIYGGIFGFFNGTTLAVMICKLAMELGENTTVIDILEQFFHKYYKRGNEMLEEIHLEFDKNDQEIRNELDWTKEKEAWRGTSGWKVITPGFPTQNAAFQIIPPSDRIINAELGNGLKKVGIFRKLIQPSAETINEKLTNLFTAQKFENKYSHFAAIVCKYPSENAIGPEFCNQIKIGSLHLINSPQIDYFHIKPEKIINKRICPEKFQTENEEKLCTIWLAGIKLKNNIIVENAKLDTAINWKERSEELTTNYWKRHQKYKLFDATLRYFSKEDLLKWMP